MQYQYTHTVCFSLSSLSKSGLTKTHIFFNPEIVLCCYAKKAIYRAGMLFHHHHQHHQHHHHHHHHHRHFIPFSRGRRFLLLDPIPVVSGRRQGTPWTSCQLITGPSGAIWGSVSHSRTLRHAAQVSPEGARS